MNYCCTGLQNLLSCAGERGHAAVVWVDSSGEPRLLLQSRGVSFDDQSKLKPADVDVMINLSAELGVKYCPFCGGLIEELVGKNREFFDELSQKHKRYVASMPKFNANS